MARKKAAHRPPAKHAKPKPESPPKQKSETAPIAPTLVSSVTGSISAADGEVNLPVESQPKPANETSHGRDHKPPWVEHLLVALAFSIFAVLLDLALSPMAWCEAYTLGGYSLAQERLLEDAKPVAVVVDLDEAVPLRDRRSPPSDAKDPDWAKVARNWGTLAQLVKTLQHNGAKAVCVDWELALRDYYVFDVRSFYDDSKIPPTAQKAYSDMLSSLVETNRLCPVVIGADWIEDPTPGQKPRAAVQWFPIAAAIPLACSLVPAGHFKGFDALGYATAESADRIRPANEVIAERLGDRLKDPPPFGFSPYETENRGPREFWIDHSMVAREAVAIDQVKGKIVVLGSTSAAGNRGDEETVPGIGSAPGGYYHAAAIGTRVSRPLYSLPTQVAELSFIFLLNLLFGGLAAGLSLLAAKFLKLEHHSPNIHFVEFWIETFVSIGTVLFILWLVNSVSTTRLLLPGISAALVVRLLEPLFTLWRHRKLVRLWKA